MIDRACAMAVHGEQRTTIDGSGNVPHRVHARRQIRGFVDPAGGARAPGKAADAVPGAHLGPAFDGRDIAQRLTTEGTPFDVLSKTMPRRSAKQMGLR
jgi:hypothetical protein